MEIYTDELNAEQIIRIAEKYGVEAKVIGKVVAAEKKSLEIQLGSDTHIFE
jgi:phosphoribosylaminoimidazole (AIR) synthetase